MSRTEPKATERQVQFIVTLAVERGFRYDNEEHTLTRDKTVVELSKTTKRGASNLITWLKDQPKQGPAKAVNYATEKQVNYLVGLADRAGWEVEDTKVTDLQGATVELTKLPVKIASELIDYLKTQPRVRRGKADPNVKITEDGMYLLDGTIYKVQVAVHGSGHLYAKRLVVDSQAVRDDDGNITQPAQVRYERDTTAMAKLLPEHRMTLEQAKAFGDLYGVCMRCGATLTDEESIERGLGPVCAGKI